MCLAFVAFFFYGMHKESFSILGMEPLMTIRNFLPWNGANEAIDDYELLTFCYLGCLKLKSFYML